MLTLASLGFGDKKGSSFLREGKLSLISIAIFGLLTGCAGTDMGTPSSTGTTASSAGTAASSNGGGTTSSSATVNQKLVYANNSGGGAITVRNVAYNADQYFVGGTMNTTTEMINGTNDDPLYQSERYGQYSYEIPVSNSTYSVILHFSEMYHTAEAMRYFTVVVEGELVFSDLDMFAEVGSKTSYGIKLDDVMVADGSLTIELSASLDNATINGFAIYTSEGGMLTP